MWKPIPVLDGRYEASENGEIRNAETGVIRKQRTDKYGYKRINIPRNDGTGSNYTAAVHKLVASAFVPNPENKKCINHIDGNKGNNNASNLEWCTYAENSKHAYVTGLSHVYHGEDMVTAKLTNKQADEIRREYALGNISQEALGKKYNISQITVSRVVRGLRYAASEVV